MTIAIDPILIAVGPLQVRWSAVFTALALVAGWLVARRWGAAAGLRFVSTALPAALVIAAGIVVGRAAVLVERPDLLRRGVAFAAVLAQGGISLPAAALGGAAALMVWAWLDKHSPARALGAAAGGLLVGEAIASVGLLLSGDYAGPITDLPWAVSYTRPDAGVPATLVGRNVHPLALYALLWSGAAVGWLWIVWPERTIGERWSLAALAYGLGHLGIGYARLDPVWLLGLRGDQFFGLVWIVIGVVGLIAGGKRVIRVVASTTGEPVR
ncbi:MAG: prolipoprotein diacylglyceryl transferase [Dehalococcoidia bacterium]|nr:MAG: prolipoprotein diacylglyceryl transferase [Dehalococcoidia bacterium]